MEVRRATAGDLTGVRDIARAYGNLHDWPRRPDYLDHELERDALWVAIDEGLVAGFAGVLVDGAVAHLADAFVRRDMLGRGAGTALLDAALPRDRTLVTFASRDPRALPLYVRAGMTPLAPVLYLSGRLEAAAHGVERVATATLTERDAAASGRARPGTLEFLGRAGAYGLVAGGAHAVVRPTSDGARLGPAAGDASGLLALVAAASAAHGTVQLSLFGPHPAVRPLLDAGFRLTDVDTYLASHPGVHDLARSVPDSDLG